MSRYKTGGERPTTWDLPVGHQIKFADDRRWWTVRASTAHYTALTRQAQFQPTGTLYYTVIDWRNDVRGPCNLIGRTWGDGSYSVDECERMLEAFERGGRRERGQHSLDEADRHKVGVSVSQRDWVHLEIVAERTFNNLAAATVVCGDETEPDGVVCTGTVTFADGDRQARCDTCGGSWGRWNPDVLAQLRAQP